MKHVDLFNEFLKETVNLNDTRVADLEMSIEAIRTPCGPPTGSRTSIAGWRMGHGRTRPSFGQWMAASSTPI